MISVYESFDGELKALWRELERRDNVLVFQTLAWCEHCERPFAIVWRGDKGETPVLLPTALSAQGELHFIGDAYGDYGDALYEPKVNKHLAFKEIAAYIRGEKRIRRVALQKMRGDSEVLAYLGVMMKGSLVYRDHMYSSVDLRADGLLLSLEQLRTHDRSAIKALMRKADDMSLEIFTARRGSPFPRERIEEIRDAMIRTGARREGFLSSEKMAFVEHLYAARLLEVAILKGGPSDEVLSLQLTKGERNLCWVPLYRDRRFNTLQMVRYFDELLKGGWKGVVDFGVGAYDYKLGTFRPQTGCTFSLRWGRNVWQTFHGVARMLWRFWRHRAR